MCRTALNVTGDLATAVVVSKGSGDIALPVVAAVSHGSDVSSD
jgi:Na+/H+-dicarboxylate symporter